MRYPRSTTFFVAALGWLLPANFVAAQADRGAPPPVPSQEQPEVLTSGPVHEAFAEPINGQDVDDFVAPTEPPADIEEMPPSERPEGEHYVWVPGYWSWDTDRTNYVWVTGCWREAPPDRSWVPGYWNRTGGGSQWVPGFWQAANVEEIEYLPAPPSSLPDDV